MRFRCIECGDKCTVSVKKGNIPKVCVLDPARACHWLPEDKAPTRPARDAHIARCRKQDAIGMYIKRIDPRDPWGGDKIYRCISDAARDTGIAKGGISRAVRSRGRQRAGEYYWDYTQMTMDQCRIKEAAQVSLEEYRQALLKYDMDRYFEVFEEGVE